MAFDPAFLDELRMRVPLADVVGRRVKLVKKGREHSGLCPFHNEKTPSFTVNEDKGFFHCFGCGAHGDVLGFVMRTENLTFPEAIEKLASDAGIQLPLQTRESREQVRVRLTLHGVLEAATDWFVQQFNSAVGIPAKTYLRARSLKETDFERFRIGFAPEGRGSLRSALVKLGYNEDLLIDAGLLRRRDDSREVYEVFRNRVIFPISDRRGQVIAFGGRVLEPAPPNAPKYLNSPDTSLFHKGQVLYGLAEALPLSREQGRLIVTEGYMDAISLLRSGIPAVAPLGTALTEEQINILWRIVPEPTLCFDGDAAGLRALERAAFRSLGILKAGKSLYLAKLPKGEDPDSLIRNRGVDSFEQALIGAKPLSEAIWEIVSSSHRLDTPEHIAALKKELDDRAIQIPDVTAQWSFRRYFRNKVWEATQLKYDKRATKKYELKVSLQLIVSPDWLGAGVEGTTERREARMIGTLVNHPTILGDYLDEFARLDILTPEYDVMRDALIEISSRYSSVDHSIVKRELESKGYGQTLKVLLGQRLYDWYISPAAPKEDAQKAFVTNLRMQGKLAIIPELEQAIQEFANRPSEAAVAKIQALRAELDRPVASEADMEDFGRDRKP